MLQVCYIWQEYLGPSTGYVSGYGRVLSHSWFMGWDPLVKRLQKQPSISQTGAYAYWWTKDRRGTGYISWQRHQSLALIGPKESREKIQIQEYAWILLVILGTGRKSLKAGLNLMIFGVCIHCHTYVNMTLFLPNKAFTSLITAQ